MKSLLPDKRAKLLIGCSVILVAGIVAGVSVFTKNVREKEREDYSELCNTDSIGQKIKESPDILRPANLDKLEPIMKEVAQLEDRDRAINCLYITTHYHVNVSDYIKAKEYFSKSEEAAADQLLEVDSDIKAAGIDLYGFMASIDELISGQPERMEVEATTVPKELLR